MQFSDLGPDAGLLRALAEAGYANTTPILAQAIPLVLAGRDLLAAGASTLAASPRTVAKLARPSEPSPT